MMMFTSSDALSSNLKCLKTDSGTKVNTTVMMLNAQVRLLSRKLRIPQLLFDEIIVTDFVSPIVFCPERLGDGFIALHIGR